MKLKVILTKQLCIACLVAILLTLLASTIGFWIVFSDKEKTEIINYSQMVVRHIERTNTASQLAAYEEQGYRITLVDVNGVVLYESMQGKNLQQMDNHNQRPEIEQARNGKEGVVHRYSQTMQQDVYYYAVLLEDGNVLRTAKEADNIASIFFRVIPVVIMISLYVFLFCFFMATRMTRKITKPIEAMSLRRRDQDKVYDELKPFVKKIATQEMEIRNQMGSIQDQKEKIGAIIANMEEGLILLDIDKRVLMKNDSAKLLLNLPYSSIVGKNIYEVCDNRKFLHCVSAAANGKNQFSELKIGEKTIQLLVNPVYTAGEQTGIICLIMDITHRVKTEKFRREFTANVSHELKTPLTSISGYAELIETGMANNEEDVKRFAHKIHKEAGRLVTLISDIIKLSDIEETELAASELQPVNLFALAKECADILEIIATKKEVEITVKGEDCFVKGDNSKLYELIYNLCDNAIRYNKERGKVCISVEKNNEKAELIVEDTGIGIEDKYTDRVFERFFREDKSRSKETGGTGLGLAIVKHVAEIHNAEISLESEKTVGTKITVVFDLLSVF